VFDKHLPWHGIGCIKALGFALNSTISSIYTCKTDQFCSGGGSQLRHDKKPLTLHTSNTKEAGNS